MGGFRLGSIMGIDVRVHRSWVIIAGLVLWTLAASALPADFGDLAASTRLLMAACITLAFFVSLLAHELAHSIVAVVRGIPVRSITFFLFGGVAETTQDSRSPGEEFLIAIAGPVCSFLLSALAFWVWFAGADAGWPRPLTGGAAYIAVLNLALGLFNLLPGFPMDGGRVLRAALWKATGSVTRATRWASRIGEWLAYGLMIYGAWDILNGALMGGIWMILIAMFIRNAARAGYRQHMVGRLHQAASQWTEARHPPAPPPPELTGRDVTGLRPGER